MIEETVSRKEKFDLEISDGDEGKFITLRDVVEYISKKIKK